MLLSDGIAQYFIDAVLANDFESLLATEAKINALRTFCDHSPDFETLATSFKRIVNILKGVDLAVAVNPDLFEEKSEENLWKAFQSIKDEADKEIEKQQYLEALNVMARLSGPIDEFFNQVMVMSKDADIKHNRMGILKEIQGLFAKVADLSFISS